MDEGKTPAVIVQRVGPKSKNNTDEICKLAESAGFSVVSTITQSREEDSEYNIGSGKVSLVHHEIQENNAKVVIFDNELDPYQKYNLGIYFPKSVEVLDRYTVILDIFEQRASTRHGKLQVELARLRYELPRVETKVRLSKKSEKPGFMGLGEYEESQGKDIKNRIKRVQEELDSIEADKKRKRKKRREEGFDIVSIAGYTNAGKSTLLRRLAKDHSVRENENKPEDLETTAESTDNLFTTLETTTRKMDFNKRDVVVTDTVGFISDLPPWIINSFKSTFSSIYYSDVVLIVSDMTEPVEKIHKKIVSMIDFLEGRSNARVIHVFNKTDNISQSELDRKEKSLKNLTKNVVSVSAKSGKNIDNLKNKIHKSLPPLEERKMYISFDNPDVMSTVSWIHNNTYVKQKEYDSEGVSIEFEAQPWVTDKISSMLNVNRQAKAD